jgi:predicted enzyme related to lactoylglutathione lyase
VAEEIRLTLVILAVEELQRAVNFYHAAFGWSQTVDEAVYAEFTLPGAMRLGLYTHAGFGRNTGQAPLKPAREEITSTELYLFVDDLSAAIEHVEAAGGRELSPRALRDWGDEAAYFADPDGNVVVLAQPHAQSAPLSEP